MKHQTPQAQMQAIRSKQEELVRQQRDIKGLVKELGQWLEDTFRLNWNQTFLGVSVTFIPGVDGGSMTNQWEPEVYVYTIGDASPTEVGEWVRAGVRVPAPVKLNDLQDFFLLFLKQTQVPVKLAYGSPYKDFDKDD